jgi:hypothetical protein
MSVTPGRGKRGEAERELAELPDRRREAMQAQARGEDAELPTGDGLQAIIAEAIERDAAIRMEEHRLTEDEHAVVDANLAFFDELAEQASREAEQELEEALEGAQAAQRAIRAAGYGGGLSGARACGRAATGCPKCCLPTSSALCLSLRRVVA